MSFTGRVGHKKSKMIRTTPYSIEPSMMPGQFSPKSSYDRSTYQFQQQLPPQQSISYKYNIQFVEYSPAIQQASHTQVVVQDTFQDLNAVIADIVSQRPPATPIPHLPQSISFTCPISGISITCPGRGVHCDHPGCFDLRQFLIFASGEDMPCPFCKKLLSFGDLRFDPTFFQCDMPNNNNNQTPDLFPLDDQWVTSILD